ncbi:MAG: DUF4184 family protein [Mucilaginibacter sp.]|uniref:DUF4184 family protein n=1 Tax=Mucilaginibacter sp. TaxID=1882438 RepID=UPI0032640F63
MPLTFSHPAIVLPLNYLPKKWVSLTGLIAGSVAPDFEYFFRMKVSSIYSHTWLGMLWFDLPVAILICFVYHDAVKVQLISNLPSILNRRFKTYQAFNWNRHFIQNLLIVLMSIIIGIASHLFWDSFTHATGYFVELWNMTVPVKLSYFQIPLYKLIQHTSTIIGGIVILIAIYQMPMHTAIKNKSIAKYWFTVAGITLAVILLRLLFGLDFHQYWNLIVTTISGVILAIVVTSLFISKSQSL